jgi:uncharacterized membrane protein
MADRALDAPAPTHHNLAHKVELIVSWLLRIGVCSSLLIVAAGAVITFIHHPEEMHTPIAQLLDRPDYPHNIRDDLTGMTHGYGRAIVVFGLLLLIATPVLRVAVTIVAFALQRDRIFVVITTVVLLLLLLSFALGKAGG